MSRTAFSLMVPIIALVVLHSGQEAEYVNAGILPYSVESGEVRLLLGFDGINEHWNDFVGVCTPGETPLSTAAREFSEETRGAFEAENVEGRLEGATPVKVGPTRIFILEVPEVPTQQLERLAKSRNSEKTSYCWVALVDLLQSVDESGPGRARVPAACGGGNARLFNLLAQSLRQGEEIRQRLLSPNPGESAPRQGPAERCGR